jgi:hypothetical protein
MSDTCTRDDSGSDDVLTVDKILKALEALDAMLPRLLYRTSEYVQATSKNGEPFVIWLPPSEVWPEASEGFLVTHPDNLSYLKTVCGGRYRLEPLVAATKEASA